MPGLPILLFAAFLAVVGLGAFFSWRAGEKRKAALAAWAAGAGLRFDPQRRAGFDAQYPGFPCLRQGDHRYAYNVADGVWRGRGICAFDYHYETHSTDSKGRRQTHHHHFSAVILDSAVPLRPLAIRPENVFDKVASFLGFDDINFESAEFSRRFHVSSPDRRWAYDVLHARSIEFLLAAPVFSIQFDAGRAIAWRTARFAPADVEAAAGTIAGLLDRLPEYVKPPPAAREASPTP